MNIDKLIRSAADHYRLDYCNETPGGANVVFDRFEGDTLWRNTNEDGQIVTDDFGRSSLRRHVQLMVCAPCNIDEIGPRLDAEKERLLRLSLDVVGAIINTGDTSGDFSTYQPTTYEAGFDRFDACLVWVLVHLYLEEDVKQCGENLSAYGVEGCER